MSLSELFAKALSKASKASSLPTVDDRTQELVQASLKDLKELHLKVAALSLFSPNETLEDIATKDLVYLFVPYVLSEVSGRLKTTEREDRLQVLEQTQRYLENYLFGLENYEVVTENDRSLYQQKITMIRDAGKRREIKIKQHQKEKELRAKLEAVRKRWGLRAVDSEGHNDFHFISMLLPSGDRSQSSEEEEDLNSETEDALRETTLHLMRLLYMQSKNQMEHMEQERDLLKNAPQFFPSGRGSKEETRREERRTAEENWRLDARPVNSGPDGKGSLLDSSGKPLRPFTILPSEASNRARLQAQVFGASHQLPTMTIDEYLEIERQRGNILTGGGRESQEAPTSTEKLTLASELDGTGVGEEKAEELRQKQENWAQFTDVNPRGAGNTMNRG
ncbi:TAP42-like protein [Amanita muscaria]